LRHAGAPRRRVDRAPHRRHAAAGRGRAAPQRRVVHAGDPIYRAGDPFGNLYLLNSGLAKVVGLSADGREQVVGLKFRGDWLGFDGIANGQYAATAIAMDTGEVWVIRYEAVLPACQREPALLTVLHAAMSREIARDRDSLMSVCTLPADARVADFLRYWAESLSTAACAPTRSPCA
jgi:CRP/FNR family transcriptional regulator